MVLLVLMLPVEVTLLLLLVVVALLLETVVVFFSQASYKIPQYSPTFPLQQGLPKVHGLRDDDLFVLSDADELPSPESLLFLRLYDGYTEPVRFGFRWNVFGFFWLKAEDPSALAKVPLLGKVRD